MRFFRVLHVRFYCIYICYHYDPSKYCHGSFVYCSIWYWALHPNSCCWSSAALVGRVLENSGFQKGGLWFRRIAGVAIVCLGGYFIIQPFLEGI